MTALAQFRDTDALDPNPIPRVLDFPQLADVKVYPGAMVALDSSGWAKPAVTATGLVIVGCAEPAVDGASMTSDSTGLANGAIRVRVKQGVFKWENSSAGDAIASDDAGKLCYAVDDQTVALTDGGGTRSIAGMIIGVDSADSKVWVMMGLFPQASSNLAALLVDLASTSNGEGASLIGIEDAATLITATTVEGALAELVKKANAGLAAPFSTPLVLSTIADTDVLARFTPGVAGKIRKITAFVKVAVTTAAKATTLTPHIAGTPTTGGALALTSANCTPKGAAVNGSAITAANAFTAAQEITIVASSTTAFVEGEVVVCLFFDPAA